MIVTARYASIGLADRYSDFIMNIKAAHYLVHKGAHKVDETALHLGQLLGAVPVHHGLEVAEEEV